MRLNDLMPEDLGTVVRAVPDAGAIDEDTTFGMHPVEGRLTEVTVAYTESGSRVSLAVVRAADGFEYGLSEADEIVFVR